jgi:hypothetical protein
MGISRGRAAGFRLTDEHRHKIANSNILTYLIEHAEGSREMGATQVQASIALLKKVLPDLSTTEHTGETTLIVQHVTRTIVDPTQKTNPMTLSDARNSRAA